ncbi:MAG: hypothetical protein SNJ64_02855, partial [Endomicrobiia bacterium]
PSLPKIDFIEENLTLTGEHARIYKAVQESLQQVYNSVLPKTMAERQAVVNPSMVVFNYTLEADGEKIYIPYNVNSIKIAEKKYKIKRELIGKDKKNKNYK